MRAIIITARMASERLPGKAMLPIAGEPNLARIVRRLKRCKAVVVVATTVMDKEIVDWCRDNQVNHYVGPADDVLVRVHDAARQIGADYILRATTDCPFISWELVNLAFDFVEAHKCDAGRIWGLPEKIPIYGAAEFPFSYDALSRMRAQTEPALREHCAADLDANRLRYKVKYAVPPRIYFETFYRPYRLELDTPDDLKLIEAVTQELGDAPLAQVVRYLDAHPELAQVNSHIAERTGPSCYSPEKRAQWKMQQVMNTEEWRGDWTWLNGPIPFGARPLYCNRGLCYLGYVIRGNDKIHRLYRRDGTVVQGRATLPCDCGAGREWYDDGRKPA